MNAALGRLYRLEALAASFRLYWRQHWAKMQPKASGRFRIARGGGAYLSLSMQHDLFERIRNGIVSGDLPSGAWLRQEELAAKYGVGRFLVRECLVRLEAEGFVTLWPGRGAQVKSLSVEEIEEIFLMRRLLEGAAAVRGVQRIGREELQEMERGLEGMRSAGGVDDFLNHNAHFHAVLLGASGYAHLQASVDRLRANVERYLRVYLGIVGHLVSRIDEHESILAAVSRHDATEAGRLVEAHIERTGQAVANAYRQIAAIMPQRTAQ